MIQPVFTGISGTNGKTTTYLLLQFLLESFSTAVARLEKPWELRKIRQHRSNNYYPLLIITNITHPLAAWQKKETWHQCLHLVRKMDKNGIIILNADDPHCLALADKARARVISYAAHYQQAMVTAREITRGAEGKYSFRLTLEEDLPVPGNFLLEPLSLKIQTPLWGEHNLYNTMAAVTAALLLQKEPKEIKKALSLFQGIRRRGEFIYTNDYTILDDRAENPPAVEALLQEACKINFSRLILLTGLNLPSSSAQAQQKASVLCSWAKKLPVQEIIFTRGGRFSNDHIEEEKRKENNFLQYFRKSQISFQFIPDGVDALYAALETTGKNDLLLLFGKGCMEQLSSLVRSIFQLETESSLQGTLNPS